MYNKKSVITILFFAVISTWIAVTSIMAGSSKLNNEQLAAANRQEKSHFINVHYFKAYSNKPSLELQSTDLVITNQVILDFEKPRGMFFMNDGRKANYTALKGNMHQTTEELELHGEVFLKDKFNKYNSDYLKYQGKKDLMNAHGNVKSVMIDKKTKDTIELTSERMSSKISSEIVNLEGNVKGKIKRKRRYEGDMNLAADKILVNSPESRVDLSNNVKIRRNNYYLSSGNGEIFLENFNKKLKYYTLYDDVKLEEKIELHSGGTQVRRAYAEKLESHQATGRVILSGAPRVEQGEDVIKGYQITLRENVELVEVDDSKSNFSMRKDKDE